uniref:HvfA family oxazolone/thioamide-modified RiPP metallophore n=1 Tax=Cellvibrio fontiphilus TaxID=1815559 RepID=UPI002B4BE945|nr:hypothetical protein [Cellvibrio fontiphilus]
MNNKITSMSALMGVALGASAALTPVVAAESGFSAQTLDTGYTLAHNHTEKTDGEHKCGEAKCGAEHKKTESEGKCGEGKCGAEKKAEAEGKCGEGKCGADKAEKKAE